MLQTQSVYPATLELLRELMKFEPLANFCLVGGTALSLVYGHRISIDLDLFTTTNFDEHKLIKQIQDEFHNHKIHISSEANNSLSFEMNNIKVDLLAHQYPLVRYIKQNEGIRMFSVEDISAMKLGAMASRGSKKDFFDIYELLQHYNLSTLLSFYKEKYQNHEIFFIIKSLTYFVDAELESDPIMLKDVKWKTVKEFLTKVVEEYSNS